MKLFNRKQHTLDLEKIEARLAAAMQPVSPRAEFVSDLRARLLKSAPAPSPTLQLDIAGKANSPRGWLVAGGVAGSAVMLIIGLRGLLSIVGLIGLLLQRRQSEEPLPATSPAH